MTQIWHQTAIKNDSIVGHERYKVRKKHHQPLPSSSKLESGREVGRPLVVERLRSLIPPRGEAAFARLAGVSQGTLRGVLQHGNPQLETLASLAKAGGVTIEWLATGEGAMRPGEAPQALVAAPDGAADRKDNEGLPIAHMAHHVAGSGVRAAVSLAVEALGDQSLDIPPDRLADIVDAAHQLLQSGAAPTLVRRLIVAAATDQ